MAVFNKRHIFTHIWVVVIIALMVFALLIYPLESDGSTLIVIQHDNSAQRNAAHQSMSQESGEINAARRSVEQRQRQVERAHQDVANAYVPRSQLYQSSRFYDIHNAENELYNAQNELRAADNDLYFQKRILESNDRQRKIDLQKRENKHYRKKIINEPPYQDYDDD